MSIWHACNGENYIQNLECTPFRVVEAQHILSSRDLVDTAEEHDLLEEMLESSKPIIDNTKDYLIFTPFRYPPLKYGSRFGSIYEPSLWYGSLDLETAFAEVAYYRFLFINDTEANLGYMNVSMTSFSAYIKSNKGIDLSNPPFNKYTKQISDPNNYNNSQELGKNMRESNIEAFIYISSRMQDTRKNIAIYTPNIFHKKRNQYINNQQTWVCLSHKNTIEFTRIDTFKTERFCWKYQDQLVELV